MKTMNSVVLIFTKDEQIAGYYESGGTNDTISK